MRAHTATAAHKDCDSAGLRETNMNLWTGLITQLMLLHSTQVALADTVDGEEARHDRVKRELGGPATSIYATGAKGEKGLDGIKGVQGAPGATGQKGSRGDRGDIGLKGERGETGEPGEDGGYISGAEGIAGMNGVSGPKGVSGQTGQAGSQGFRGATGSTGLTGERGSTGYAGPIGSIGVKGPSGVKGPQGPTGSTGEQGEKGRQGDQGDDGDRGVKGDAGVDLSEVRMANSNCSVTICVNAMCKDSVLGAICVCDEGYMHYPNRTKECQDVDECLEGFCSHNCHNTNGSFTCLCDSGYELASDGRSCTIVQSTDCASCLDDQNCLEIGGGTQCLPADISVYRGGAAQSLQLAGRAQREEVTTWLDDEWMIIMLVWTAILTVFLVILTIWLVHEHRNSRSVRVDRKDLRQRGIHKIEYLAEPMVYMSAYPRLPLSSGYY